MFKPIRTDVNWEYFGPSGPHPDLDGVSGKRVRILQSKKLTRFERIIAGILNAPENVNRDLDDLNSLLWELMDGTRTFDEICFLMESNFHERILPTRERVLASIDQMVTLGYIRILNIDID